MNERATGFSFGFHQEDELDLAKPIESELDVLYGGPQREACEVDLGEAFFFVQLEGVGVYGLEPEREAVVGAAAFERVFIVGGDLDEAALGEFERGPGLGGQHVHQRQTAGQELAEVRVARHRGRQLVAVVDAARIWVVQGRIR